MGGSMSVIDILSDNLTAWDGEEDSVREEHSELIEATRACLESVDARLIAAAPDLLAALQDMVDLFRTMHPDLMGNPFFIHSRAAIAKAEAVA